MNQSRETSLETLCREFLLIVGETPNREGLMRTPSRVAKSIAEILCGYSLNLKDIVNDAVFTATSSGMVVIRDIEFFSLCEHHLLPFFGQASIAYIPNNRIIGLSKAARIVEMYSRRLQVQERLTNEIAMAFEETLKPKGVACILEASHLCMMMRGVRQQNSKTISTFFSGDFENNPSLRQDFFASAGVNRANPITTPCLNYD
jgi:GTP cyclohydrolase I